AFSTSSLFLRRFGPWILLTTLLNFICTDISSSLALSCSAFCALVGSGRLGFCVAQSPTRRSRRPSPFQSTAQTLARMPRLAPFGALGPYSVFPGDTSSTPLASTGEPEVAVLRYSQTLPSPLPTSKSRRPLPSQSAANGPASPSTRRGLPPASS